MAIAPVNKFISLAVPVAPGEQKLYEVPTGASSLVLYAQVSNVGVGTYPTVTFIQKRTQRSTGSTRDIRVIKDVEIPPNDALILIDGRMVLEKTPLIIDSLYISGTQTGVSTINNVLYHEPTGVATVTTMDPHGFDVGSEITMAGIAFTCPPKTGITTTIFPEPQKSYIVDTVIDTKNFTSIVGGALGYKHTYNPAIHKFVKARTDAIDVSGTKYTPTGANYDSKTGILDLTIPCNNILESTASGSPQTYTVVLGAPFNTSWEAYLSYPDVSPGANDRNGGIPQEMDPDININLGDTIVINLSSMAYSASGTPINAFSGNAPCWIKYGPSSYSGDIGTDNAVGTGADSGNNPTATNNGVSKTTDITWTPTTAGTYYYQQEDRINMWGKIIVTDVSPKQVGAGTTYNAAVGILTVTTTTNHNYNTGDLVKFDDSSLKFRCSLDNYTGIHTYPRISDPIRGVWLGITTTSSNTFEVNVGKSPFNYFDVSTADYDGVSGIVTCNIGSHSLTAGTNIKLATESLGFICEAGAGTKYYPRASGTGNPGGGPDPGFSTSVTITAVDTNTVSLDVGKITSVSNTGVHTFVAATPKTITDAEYDPISGIMIATIPGHGMYDGDAIKIDTNSISFSCNYCGAAGVSSIKSYPRTKDPIADKFVAIGNTTVNTFEVNVGAAGGNTSEHTFKSATTGGVTRAVITSGGNYNHRWEEGSWVNGSMKHSTQKISIANTSLYFTCSMDNFSTEHGYPRATDPVSGINTSITRADYNTISAFVGVNSAGGLVAPLQMEFLASILENSNA